MALLIYSIKVPLSQTLNSSQYAIITLETISDSPGFESLKIRNYDS